MGPSVEDSPSACTERLELVRTSNWASRGSGKLSHVCGISFILKKPERPRWTEHSSRCWGSSAELEGLSLKELLF